jgi:hypothetical protein
MKYRVEIFQDNHWCRWSTHKSEENAMFRAETLYKSKNKSVRVIYKGMIIMAYYINHKGKEWIVTDEEI